MFRFLINSNSFRFQLCSITFQIHAKFIPYWFNFHSKLIPNLFEIHANWFKINSNWFRNDLKSIPNRFKNPFQIDSKFILIQIKIHLKSISNLNVKLCVCDSGRAPRWPPTVRSSIRCWRGSSPGWNRAWWTSLTL